MRTPDSRSRSGDGIQPLRHEDFQSDPNYADVSQVIGGLGKNVTGRRPAPALGHYKDRADTIGNRMPWHWWPKETRPAPGHAPVWPAIVGDGLVAPAGAPGSRLTPTGGATRGAGGNLNESAAQLTFAPPPRAGTTVALSAGATSDGSPYTMRPVIGETMDPDTRFQSAPFATPREGPYKLWPRFPEGYYGIALPATNEERQVNLFLPTDPRLVAVNFDDDPAYGSLVCDMDGDGAIDVERMARLQSAFRVVVRPRSGLLNFPDANCLAFQLNASGNGDTMGGLFFDVLRGNIMGHGAVQTGGPFDVGTAGDRHRLGEDADGNQVNSLHLSLSALFLDRSNSDIDGPLYHEGYKQGAVRAPHRTNCHFVFDPTKGYQWIPAVGGFSRGMHVWESESFLYVPNAPTGGPPTGGPPPPPNTPTGGPPTTPSGGDGGGSGGGNPGTTPPAGPPPVSSGSGGNGDDPTAGGTPPGATPGVGPHDQFGPSGKQDAGFGAPPPGPSPHGPNPAPLPGKGAGGGGQGGGVIPVGPLPPGSDFPKWKNPDGSDPFGPFGFGGGKHNKHWAQQQAARAARRAARKAKHKKGGVFGIKFVPPAPPGPGVPRGKFPGGKPHGFDPKFKGFPADAGPDFFGRIAPPAPPNVFSPGGAPGSPIYASPTPATGPASVPGAPPAVKGPMPTGSYPVPVFPVGATNEIMLPSILIRPQSYSRLAPDLRYDTAPDRHAVRMHDRTAPVTGHLVGYGAQGGTVGGNPGDTQPNYWKYTQKPRTGKFWAGTAPGGLALVCPEVDLSDLHLSFAPSGVSRSPVYLVATPGTYFAWGKPDIANGGIFSGWRSGISASGLLTFEEVNSSGTVVRTVTFPSMSAIFGQTADATVGGTGVETSIIGTGSGTSSIPANGWRVGMSVMTRLRGKISTVAVPGNVTVKGKLAGATNLSSGAVQIPANLSNIECEVEFVATCRDLSTPSAAVFAGAITFRSIGVTGATTAQYVIGSSVWSGTVDTTAAVSIGVTFQWSTSDPNNTITTTVGKIDTETPA